MRRTEGKGEVATCSLLDCDNIRMQPLDMLQEGGVLLGRVEALRSCYLFTDADAQSVELLGEASHVVRLPAGSALFSAGDESNGLYIMRSGLVRIWVADTEGRELTLALMEPGDPFGEIALLDRLPRSASATAIEDTICLLTPVSAMEAALEQNPRLARHLIEQLCEILRRNTRELSGYAFLSLDARLAQKLYELALAYAETDGKTAHFTRRFSQTELAQMLGATREAVNKRLAALVHDGLVRQKDGYVTLTDLAALKARVRMSTGLAARR
ncbi:MAG: Crp/Fnr family transcriptional regulator [Gammaproteobacteria bacterium]|nr:MAG: Crp/Fnr family transcriptional regulator [Gammaproteobacteria bacterium]